MPNDDFTVIYSGNIVQATARGGNSREGHSGEARCTIKLFHFPPITLEPGRSSGIAGRKCETNEARAV
jgi:hypothetical protein